MAAGTTAVIIPTLNSGAYLPRLLPALAAQTLQPEELIIIDSNSSDGSVAAWRRFGARVISIPAASFNHGGTRRFASELTSASTLIYLTQDAVPACRKALQKLRTALYADDKIGLCYGRQLPHPGAGALAMAAREFNYPAQSRSKCLKDAATLGIKTCFCSDAFAAYRKDALQKAGGFPQRVIGSEDAYVAARMLLAGLTVQYAAEAQVYHSHDYTPLQEFRRYFDIGVFYRRERWIEQAFGTAGGEGLRYVLHEWKRLLRHHPSLLLQSMLQNAAKIAGYRLGHWESHLPLAAKKRLSMSPSFWSESVSS